MINEKSNPPVCKIVDAGKMRYQAELKKKENAKKTNTKDVKEVKLTFNIASHDYDVRKRAAMKFLSQGHRVKCTVQFRGREQQHSAWPRAPSLCAAHARWEVERWDRGQDSCRCRVSAAAALFRERPPRVALSPLSCLRRRRGHLGQSSAAASFSANS